MERLITEYITMAWTRKYDIHPPPHAEDGLLRHHSAGSPKYEYVNLFSSQMGESSLLPSLVHHLREFLRKEKTVPVILMIALSPQSPAVHGRSHLRG